MAILKDLIVHGSSRFLNKIYADELEVSAFEAESAIIKKLTAKDSILGNATVVGLLDVQGQLHTNTWTNSNIATIDGCFYITPTLSSDSGKISFSSTSVASLTGTYTAVTSLYIGDSSSGSTVQWTKDSKILLTGEVEVNGQWLPLGTLLGTLSANATTSSIGLTGLTDNRHNPSSIITDIRNAVSNTSLNYRNLKISLYQRKDGNDSKPLGIYMTAMGANGKTFIDIYGGVNATTTAGSSGGFADPNLRIGNLSGLGAVEGTTPTGWGIYTTNGYFKGVIVSSAGKIGNFTINSALYSNNHSAWNSNVSGIYINNDGISGGAGGKWWLWNDGSAKIGAMTLSAAGVLTVPAANVSGKLTAATIDGTQITANTITAGQIAASAITTDELAANAVTSAKIKAGEVKADNIAADAVTAAKINVDNLSAISASMGTLTSGTISYGTVGSNSSFYLSSSDTSATIAGASRTGLRLTVGPNFGVSNTGVLYASSAIISGEITATSGTIGGASITNGVLLVKDANISGKISANHIDVSSITIGNLSGADNYALKDDVPTTVAELTDSGSYLTTSAASTTYATQTNLNNEINARKAVYGTSSTDAGTANKAVTCSNFALYTGASVTVTFSKTNTSSAPQLNVNSTGAKPIKSYTGTNLTEGEYKWAAGASITFTYDGTNWRMQDGGALQAKIDAASSASTASSQAGVATQQATNATNAKTAAESAKTAAESAKTAAQSAKTAAETAQGAAETASSQASNAKDAAVSAKNDAVSAKTNAQTAAGNASQSATNAANSATAAAEVMGGFTILWNYSAFGTSDNGEGYLCAFDPATGTKSDANGWVKWNGVKRTITKQMINPNTVLPYNIPIYVVCRLSSASATTGTNYMVWYNSGWKYAIMPTPTAVGGSWTWADNTDIILGKFVETASEAALTEYEIYNPPYTSKQITTNVVTAQSASASAASAAQTATTYITNIDSNNGIRIQPVNYSTNKDSVQINSTAITMYRNEVDVMSLGDSAFRMGTASGKHTTVDSNGLHVWIGSESTAANEVGLFGSTARIGAPASSRFLLNADSLQAYNSSNVKYFEVSASGLSFGGNAVAKASDIPTTVAQLTDSGSYLTTTVAANTYATTTAVNNAAETASKYITAIDQNGIKIHAENNSTTNYALINANGMSIYQNVSGAVAKVADFNQNAVTFYDGNGDGDENITALFGKDGAQVGYNSLGHIMLSSNEMRVVDDDGSDMFSVGPNGANDYVETTKTVETTKRVVTSEMSAYPHIYTYSLPLTNYTTGGYLKVNFYVSYNSSSGGMTYEHTIRQTETFVIGTRQVITTGVQDVRIKLDYMSTEQPGTVNDKKLRVEVYKTVSATRKFCLSSINYEGFTPMPAYNIGTRAINANNPGAYSTIIGEGLIATGNRQTAIGKFNIEDTSNEYGLIVGNGTDSQNRSNALTVDWSGNLIVSGGAAFNNNTSIDGSLNITGSITKNGKSLFKKEDVTVTVTYAAGTIGSRGGVISLGTTLKSGYAYLGAYILNNQSTSSFSAIISRNDDTANAMLLVYRATGNAVSNAEIKVRKIWVLNSFVTT